VHWIGGSLQEAIFEGVREGTKSGYLRWSVTGDPLRGGPDKVRPAEVKMAGGDTPAVIHTEIVPGSDVQITFASKGFGAENMSALKMFVPADGVPAIADFVLETVDRAGANACPPIIVGVGVGGTFETAALLAKKAVLRPINVRHPRADLCRLVCELLDSFKDIGIETRVLCGGLPAIDVYITCYTSA